MHITHAIGHLLGGRSRNLVATLIVAFCATLALSISMPVPADAAGPATSGAWPDMASARGTGPVMASGKTNHGHAASHASAIDDTSRAGQTDEAGSRLLLQQRPSSRQTNATSRRPATSAGPRGTSEMQKMPSEAKSTAPWWRIGYLSFTGCHGWELADFMVIQEDGPPGILPPSNGITYEADGFWFRPVRDAWYKIGGLGTWVEVQCTASAITAVRRRGPDFPRWSTDGIHTSYPW